MKKNILELYRNILINERAAFVINKETFSNNIKEMLSAFRAHYPNVEIGYSYKTNYIPNICELAHELGCWAEVVSEMEIEMALKILNDQSKIIYNGPIKTMDALLKIILSGGIINIDDMEDIYLIEKLKDKCFDQRANVALRLNYDFDNSPSRFGMDHEEVTKALNHIAKNKLFKFVGFHLHLPFRSLDSFGFRVRCLLDTLDKLSLTEITYLNIGGGFFGNVGEELKKSLNIGEIPSYSDYARLIGTELYSYFTEKKWSNFPTLFLEPGSSVVADALTFISKINKIKKINKAYFAVTFAARHLLSPTNKVIKLPINIHRLNPLEILPTERQVEYLITGFSCIESDIIGSVVLNRNIDNNDFVEITNVGSYSVVMGSDFILPQPAIYIFDSSINLVRRKNEVKDVTKLFLRYEQGN
jgi:diaminopimelate decarboxylase